MRFEAVGEGVDIDDGGSHAGIAQARQHVVDQHLAADLDQGLGAVVGQGAHAGAQARRQHHGGGRLHRRLQVGAYFSIQAFSGARSGRAISVSR